MVKVEADEDFDVPLAKLSGSNHYLFKKGLIGTTPRSLLQSGYEFDYFNPKEIHHPVLIKYSENTNKHNYLRSHKSGILYVLFLYVLYYILTTKSIDVTAIPTWNLLDKVISSRFVFGAIIFVLLLLAPEFYFELRTDEKERKEKIIIQQKSAPYPFEYDVRHHRKFSAQLIEEGGYIARLSILCSMIAYRSTNPGNESLWEGSMTYPVLTFAMISFMWFWIRWFTSKNSWINLSGKYSKIKSSDINDFFLQLEHEIHNELSQVNTPIEELIGIGPGETESLEFKASYWTETEGENIGQRNKCLEDAIVKEVAAFLNTNGGVLLIGIHDDTPYSPTGTLEKDLSQFSSKKTRGDLELHIGQILDNNLICKDSLNGCWRIRFPMYRGTRIIRIDIDKAPRYVIAYQPHEQKKKGDDKTRQFHFWRQGSRSKEPSPQTWMDHIVDNWSN